jgi:hypothetical protein
MKEKRTHNQVRFSLQELFVGAENIFGQIWRADP